MSASILSAVIIGLPVFVFLAQVSAFVGLSKGIVTVMFFHALGLFGVNFATAKFSYDKQSYKTFFISLLLTSANVALSMLLIFMQPFGIERYKGYILGHALPYAAVGIFFICFFILKGKSCFDKKYWRFVLALCLPLIFHQLSNSLLHQCDKIMMQQMTNDSAVGIYGLGVTIAGGMNIIWSALNTTFVPFYHDDIREQSFKNLRKRTNNYAFLYSV